MTATISRHAHTIWENVQKPEGWTAVGGSALVAALILKVHLIAIAALPILFHGIMKWVEAYQDEKALASFSWCRYGGNTLPRNFQ